MQASRQLFRVAATRVRPTSRLQAVRCLATDAKPPIHILAISGSLRNASCNTGLLRACAKKLPPNVTMEIYVPIDLPLINQDLETGTLPPNVAAWQEKVKKADAFLFGCPEYNFSVSAPLKNAIDWASRGQHGFNDKPAAIVGAGGGAGSLRAQMHLRDIANFLNLHFFNTPFITARIFDKPSPFDLATGDVVDEKLQQQAQAMVQALVDWTYRLKK